MAEVRQQRTGNDGVSILEGSVLEECIMAPSELTQPYILYRPRKCGRTAWTVFKEQCPSDHFHNRPHSRPLNDRQRAARDQLIEGCRLQTARTEMSGDTAGEVTLAPRGVDQGDVLRWMWKLFLRLTLLLFIYLNFVSSDNDIKQNNRNNGIADDTGNRRELVHLHGTYT